MNPRDLAVFVPAMIGLMPLLTILQILVTSPIFLVTPGRLSHAAFKWIVGLQDVEGAMLLAAFVLVAIGKGRKEIIYPCFRLPSVYYAALAVMLATVVFQVWPIVSYVQDRHAWAAIRWVVIQPPQFLSYFGLPQPRMLWLLIPALVEEFAWRGYLQPIFIRRYGLLRGIFLVSVAWGAFHFSSDFRSSMTDVQVLFGIATRIGVTVALGYVLAWITIRSESIVPAALLHGIYNVFIYSSLPTQAPVWFLAVVLGLLGYILFRYWPPVVPVDSAQPDLVAEPDPAI
ncbi:MAG: type II CAAX endopeptidase family protein [Candidatus Acidiferrales bacterium]